MSVTEFLVQMESENWMERPEDIEVTRLARVLLPAGHALFEALVAYMENPEPYHWNAVDDALGVYRRVAESWKVER